MPVSDSSDSLRRCADACKEGYGYDMGLDMVRRSEGQPRMVPTDLSIKDDLLIWAWGEDVVGISGYGIGKAQKKPSDSASVLNEFVRVFEKESRVLEFAQSHGPLGCCRHGLPLNHGAWPESGSMGDRAGYKKAPNKFTGILFTTVPVPDRYYCQPRALTPVEKRAFSLTDRRNYLAESLSAWRFYSEQAGAVLRIIGQLKLGLRAPTVDVFALYAALRGEPIETSPNEERKARYRTSESQNKLALRALLMNDEPHRVGQTYTRVRSLISDPEIEKRRREALSALGHDREFQWDLIASTLNGWLAHAPVRFYCDNKDAGQKFKIRPYVGDERGIFPELALLLTTAATGLRSPLVCSGCGLPFMPVREPTTGERTYCQVCRDNRVPQRDAERAYREDHPRKAKKSEVSPDGKKTRPK